MNNACCRPASIDAANGYRYYSRAQVKLGRLIRTLRDMDLPLEEIAAVVTAEGARAEMLLRHFALELDRRFAREKRALQAALMLMRASPGGDALAIVERERDAMTVAVSAFTATRERLVESYRMQLARMRDTAVRAGLSPLAEGYCALIDPVSDEEGRLEILLTARCTARCTGRRDVAAHACGDVRSVLDEDVTRTRASSRRRSMRCSTGSIDVDIAPWRFRSLPSLCATPDCMRRSCGLTN